MFQFPGFASPLREMIDLAVDRVSPFGNPGITACLQLPQAYRSLPRPSSPPCAKASTVRSYALDLSVSVCFLNTTTHHSSVVKELPTEKNCDRAWKVRANIWDLSRADREVGAYSAFQKGGDPAAGSPTATLLRLRPSHRIDLRRLPPCGWPTGFGSLRLPWRDGRCVQGPGTYSPRRG